MSKTNKWIVQIEFRRGYTGKLERIQYGVPTKREANSDAAKFIRQGYRATVRKSK